MLTHNIAHPIPYLHLEVATAKKKITVSEARYHGQTYSYWIPPGAEKIKRKDPLWWPIHQQNLNGGALGGCTVLVTLVPIPTVFLVAQQFWHCLELLECTCTCGGQCQSKTQADKEGTKVLAHGAYQTCAPLWTQQDLGPESKSLLAMFIMEPSGQH